MMNDKDGALRALATCGYNGESSPRLRQATAVSCKGRRTGDLDIGLSCAGSSAARPARAEGIVITGLLEV